MLVFDSIAEFARWLEALPPLWIYVTLFVIAYGENVIPPIPGDVAIVIGGYLVGLGLIGFAPTVVLATIGSTLGFITMYGLGVWMGDAVEDPNRLRWFPKGPVRTSKRWLQRWGYGVVVANRFLSGARAMIALLAGASDLRTSLTSVLAAVSALIWTLLLTYAGYAVGANWQRILPVLRAYGLAITGLLLAVGLVVFVRWKMRRRRAAQRNSEDPRESDS